MYRKSGDGGGAGRRSAQQGRRPAPQARARRKASRQRTPAQPYIGKSTSDDSLVSVAGALESPESVDHFADLPEGLMAWGFHDVDSDRLPEIIMVDNTGFLHFANFSKEGILSIEPIRDVDGQPFGPRSYESPLGFTKWPFDGFLTYDLETNKLLQRQFANGRVSSVKAYELGIRKDIDWPSGEGYLPTKAYTDQKNQLCIV